MRVNGRLQKRSSNDMKRTTTKKKIHKTNDPHYHVHTYSGFKNPFEIEIVKYYNQVEGRNQVIFLYKDKDDGKIVKYRVMR